MVVNAWDNSETEEKVEITSSPSPGDSNWESNKQEVPPQDKPLHAAGTSIDIPPPAGEVAAEERHRPSIPRLLLRVWQLFAAIGAFGFQVGASPVSKEYNQIVLMYKPTIQNIVLWRACSI